MRAVSLVQLVVHTKAMYERVQQYLLRYPFEEKRITEATVAFQVRSSCALVYRRQTRDLALISALCSLCCDERTISVRWCSP